MPPVFSVQVPAFNFKAVDEESTRAAIQCIMHGEIASVAISGDFLFVEFKKEVPLFQAGASLRCLRICTLCGVTVDVNVPFKK
jgi:hypothetical protein